MPLDIIILGAVALFLIFRLGGVLGKRTGHQGRPNFPGPTPGPENRQDDNPSTYEDDDNVVQLPKAFEEPESPLFDGPAGVGLRKIADVDSSFHPEEFVDGARMAFEMIVASFAEADRKTLKQLLDAATYESFAGAIDAREAAGERMEDTLIGIDVAEIVEADLTGSIAKVTVKFVSQQINVTYDSENRVLDGDPTGVETVTDIWTFARDVTARDPNWQLVETRNG